MLIMLEFETSDHLTNETDSKINNEKYTKIFGRNRRKQTASYSVIIYYFIFLKRVCPLHFCNRMLCSLALQWHSAAGRSRTGGSGPEHTGVQGVQLGHNQRRQRGEKHHQQTVSRVASALLRCRLEVHRYQYQNWVIKIDSDSTFFLNDHIENSVSLSAQIQVLKLFWFCEKVVLVHPCTKHFMGMWEKIVRLKPNGAIVWK